MTSAPTLRPPLQPTSKAASTAQSSHLQAIAGQTPATSRSSSRATPHGQPERQESSNHDFLSEKTTTSLIRRVLVVDGTDTRVTPEPIEAVLPPLTSSNEVDIQLYAVIAIIIKDFVNTWYSRITQDHVFVEEIVQIFAHCSRAIEQRLRQIDVVELCLDEIPTLLHGHVEAYRTANDSLANLSYGKQPAKIYHMLNPHPALDPSLSIEEQYSLQRTYRQLLVKGVLASLLPTEDLQNSPLRILVTDVIADLILGRVIDDRLCKGWFLHEAISKVTAAITTRTQPKVTGAEMQADARSRLEKFGLLHANGEEKHDNSPAINQSTLTAWFWMVLQWAYLAIMLIRLIISGLMHARRLPPRWRHSALRSSPIQKSATPSPPNGNDPSSHLVLNYRAFTAVSTLLNLSRRMPWLEGSLCFMQHVLTSRTGRNGPSDSLLDKFLYNSLQTHVFTPSLIPLILKTVRATIFPGNKMGPPAPPPPSEDEAREIRRKAAQDLLSFVPGFVLKRFFATDNKEEMLEQVEEDILDTFGNESMNKHLVYGILDSIVVRLVPEMAEKSPSALLAERGVTTVDNEKEDDQDALGT